MWLFPDASCTSFVFLGFIPRDRCVIEHSLYKRMVGRNLKAFCRICAVCAEVVYWIGCHFFKQHSLTRTTLLLTMRHSVCSPPLCPSCHFLQIQASTSPCAKVPKSQPPTDMPPAGTFEVFGTSPTDATSTGFGVLQTKPQNTSEAQTIQETAEVNEHPVSMCLHEIPRLSIFPVVFHLQLLPLLRVKVLTALLVRVGCAGKTSFGVGS